MEAFCQQRTGERARRMVISQLACVGRHTVTGLLYTGGRQFIDWSGDYRLFSRDRWDSRKLFVPVARGILEFLPADAPLVGAMNDTILEKTGTKIPGVAYRRDPLSPHFHVNFIRGQRFLQFSGMLPAGGVPGAARAIPLRFEHVPPVDKPKKSASEEQWKAYDGLFRPLRDSRPRDHEGSGIPNTTGLGAVVCRHRLSLRLKPRPGGRYVALLNRQSPGVSSLTRC